MSKNLIRRVTILLLVVLMTFSSVFLVFADTIYVGGSSNAGSGIAGNWTISVPSDYFIALKIGIEERTMGDFAENGYYNSYPDVGDNYIILVPNGTFKTKSVLTDMNNIEYNSSHVYYGTENYGARQAVWNLFMSNVSNYKGNAKELVGNTSLTNWTDWITYTSLNAAGISSDYLDITNGKMLVSNEYVKEDIPKKQAAIAGMAICMAINEAGGNIDLTQAAKYFTGSPDAAKEYLPIIEHVTCMKDSSNPQMGYWWIDNLTVLSASLGMEIKPNMYVGSTSKFFEYLIEEENFPITKVTGHNKTGYRLNSDNQVRNYLFNYWYTPTYGANYWSLNAIVSSLYYTRAELWNDDRTKKIWEQEFDPSADGSDMYADLEVGFNLIPSLVQQEPTKIYMIKEKHIDLATGKILYQEIHPVEAGSSLTLSSRIFEGLKYTHLEVNGEKKTEASYTFNNIQKDGEISFYYEKPLPLVQHKIEVWYKLSEQKSIKFAEETLNHAEIFEFNETQISSVVPLIKDGTYQFVERKESTDGGLTWQNLTTEKDISEPAVCNKIYLYQYTNEEPKEPELPPLKAELIMEATPSVIKKGETATVNYRLNASHSTGEIVKYEWFIGKTQAEVEKKDEPDAVTTTAKWNKNIKGVSPNTIKYGKVIVTDKYGQTDVAYANVKVGEEAPEPTIDIDFSLDCNDSRIIDKIYEDYEYTYIDGEGNEVTGTKRRTVAITVELTLEEYYSEWVELTFLMDARGSSSTNGIGNYKYNYTDSGKAKEANSDSAISYATVEMYVTDMQIFSAECTVNDSVVTTLTAQDFQPMTIFFVKPKVPPTVDLHCQKPVVLIDTDEYFSVNYVENEDTFEIMDKSYEIIQVSTGKVIESGKGEIPKTVAIDEKYSDLGQFEAIQYIYYEDKNGELQKSSDSEIFKVIEPIPAVEIKATMVTELQNGIITKEKDITNGRERGKQFKQIIISLAGSETATESIIQETYPILWDKAIFTLEKMTYAYKHDISGNDKIYTYNSADKVIIDDVITISGKKELSFRFDDYGTYRIRAKVQNAVRESVWATAYITLIEDLDPQITDFVIEGADFNIETQTLTAYRTENDNMETKLKIKVKSNTLDDDTIDLAKIKLYAVYDSNQDKDFTNDTESYYTAKENRLYNFMTAVPLNTSTDENKNVESEIELTIDNRYKNYLGLYKYEIEVWENPSIPDYTGGDLPAIRDRKADTKESVKTKDKVVEIENYAPTIELEVGKEPTAEVRILKYGEPSFDYEVMEEWNVNTSFIIDGKEEVEQEQEKQSEQIVPDAALYEWFEVDLEKETIKPKDINSIEYYTFDNECNRYFVTIKEEKYYLLKVTPKYQLEYCREIDLDSIFTGYDYTYSKVISYNDTMVIVAYANTTDDCEEEYSCEFTTKILCSVWKLSTGEKVKLQTETMAYTNNFEISFYDRMYNRVPSYYSISLYSPYFLNGENIKRSYRFYIDSYLISEKKLLIIGDYNVTFTDKFLSYWDNKKEFKTENIINKGNWIFMDGYNDKDYATNQETSEFYEFTSETDKQLMYFIHSPYTTNEDPIISFVDGTHFYNMQFLYGSYGSYGCYDMHLYEVGTSPQITDLQFNQKGYGENTEVIVSGKSNLSLSEIAPSFYYIDGTPYYSNLMTVINNKTIVYAFRSSEEDTSSDDEDEHFTKIDIELKSKVPIAVEIKHFSENNIYGHDFGTKDATLHIGENYIPNEDYTQWIIKDICYGSLYCDYFEIRVTRLDTGIVEVPVTIGNYKIGDIQTDIDIKEDGTFEIKFNTSQLTENNEITITTGIDKNYTAESNITIPYYKMLTKLYSLLNLGPSNSGLVALLDNTEVTIDNNEENHKLIQKIVESAERYGAGVYVIDTGNTIMTELAEKIMESEK